MKNYSALDRTASALPNTMNYQQMMGKNNAQINLPENISRFSSQGVSTSNSLSSNNPSSYPTPRSNMPNPNYSNSTITNSNQQQQYQHQMSYQQQRQMPPLPSEQQQQKQQMQPTNISQGLGSQQSTTSVGPSPLPPTSMPMMSPNQIQPVIKSHPASSERPQMNYPNQNEAKANIQQPPKNIPMLALQQQKVTNLYNYTF